MVSALFPGHKQICPALCDLHLYCRISLWSKHKLWNQNYRQHSNLNTWLLYRTMHINFFNFSLWIQINLFSSPTICQDIHLSTIISGKNDHAVKWHVQSIWTSHNNDIISETSLASIHLYCNMYSFFMSYASITNTPDVSIKY